jgi:3-phosphoshikimate 1-carboxyvinyltransferase
MTSDETFRSYPAQLPIRTRGPVVASVRPPGSKSVTNRALIVAALSDGVSLIRRPLHSDDTAAMTEALSSLGIEVADLDGDLRVTSDGLPRVVKPVIDARGSGTTARFITAMATLAHGEVVVDGNARMRERPIADLVEALAALGADVEIEGEGGCPPVRIRGPRLAGGHAWIDASRSSQYVSAVMMAAPMADSPVHLSLGGPVVSRPYIVSTAEVMRAFGGVANLNDDEIHIERGRYSAADYAVEPDASAAAYPWVAAAITGGRVTVEGIGRTTSQADIALLDVLQSMGCGIDETDGAITVHGPEQLRGVDVDMNHCPDAVLAAAVAASFATGTTVIRNVGNLRIKETDRLAALETELSRLGHDVTTGTDWIRVAPGQARGAVVSTYDDHRMAMSFSLVGLVVPDVIIDDPGCVAKTWPGFFDELERW